MLGAGESGAGGYQNNISASDLKRRLRRECGRLLAGDICRIIRIGRLALHCCVSIDAKPVHFGGARRIRRYQFHVLEQFCGGKELCAAPLPPGGNASSALALTPNIHGGDGLTADTY